MTEQIRKLVRIEVARQFEPVRKILEEARAFNAQATAREERIKAVMEEFSLALAKLQQELRGGQQTDA